MKKLCREEDTLGVLMGIPMFLVGRLYVDRGSTEIHKNMWWFEFENGYGASVVEFTNRMFSGGQDYEAAVTQNGRLCYTTEITGDVVRGNETFIDVVLTYTELLDSDGKLPIGTELDLNK